MIYQADYFPGSQRPYKPLSPAHFSMSSANNATFELIIFAPQWLSELKVPPSCLASTPLLSVDRKGHSAGNPIAQLQFPDLTLRN
jgi:hypothetical protein